MEKSFSNISVEMNDPYKKLTPKELEVLEILAENPKITIKQIAKELNRAVPTIYSRIYDILSKLKCNNIDTIILKFKELKNSNLREVTAAKSTNRYIERKDGKFSLSYLAGLWGVNIDSLSDIFWDRENQEENKDGGKIFQYPVVDLKEIKIPLEIILGEAHKINKLRNFPPPLWTTPEETKKEIMINNYPSVTQKITPEDIHHEAEEVRKILPLEFWPINDADSHYSPTVEKMILQNLGLDHNSI